MMSAADVIGIVLMIVLGGLAALGGLLLIILWRWRTR